MRALDDASVASGSFFSEPVHGRDMAELGANAYRLEQAYEESQVRGYDSDGKPIDPANLSRLAESEEAP